MLKVLAVPAFEDNYLWLIHNGEFAAVVDPGDAAPILTALDDMRLRLVAILLTHHHSDHVGGVAELKRRFKVPVYGPQESRIAEITIAVDQNDIVHLPELCLELIVLKVPGHTLTHIAYHSQTEHWLFCGDTLFGAGCGRLFEGTPSQMYESLQKLASLADNTEVYCAHEYTLANLKFAEAVEQGNAAVRERIANEQAKRSRNLPTVPSSIGLEKATNPFLRCNEPEVQARVRSLNPSYGNDGLAIFTALREWKNVFC